MFFFCFFFFQAEDGIRDRDVTGVQTCAFRSLFLDEIGELPLPLQVSSSGSSRRSTSGRWAAPSLRPWMSGSSPAPTATWRPRSEERRVGKECRSRWAEDQE